jgi:NDP-hexose 4,6-dehydratase
MSTTVAVTGADGFIGSHLVELLVEEGYGVKAMAQYNSFGSAGWLEQIEADTLADVDVCFGDVRDPDSVNALLTGVDVVCHLAALIGIPYSYEAPSSYLQTNVLGTHHVLEAARRIGTSRVVCTSTSEVYGTARAVPISEDHPLQAQSPYAASKIAADKLAESYHLSFGVPVVTLRPFNTFGPRQSARAVIPTVIAQVAAGRTQVVLGSLLPTRDFNYVRDTARAFIAAIRGPAKSMVGRTFNAGSGREVSIAATVELIGEVMGRQVEVVADSQRIRPEGSEVMRLVSDSSALHAATSWKPEYTLEDGLAATAAWFCDPRNQVHYNIDRYNV